MSVSKVTLAGSVTLRDVARVAGVHPGTVSRALNPETRGLVNERTAQRVLAAAKELGYRPNPIARGLRTNRSNTIGVLVPDLMNPLFAAVVRGIEDGLRDGGYTPLIANTDNDPERERVAFERYERSAGRRVHRRHRPPRPLAARRRGRLRASRSCSSTGASTAAPDPVRPATTTKASASPSRAPGRASEGVTGSRHFAELPVRRAQGSVAPRGLQSTRRRPRGLDVDPGLADPFSKRRRYAEPEGASMLRRAARPPSRELHRDRGR